MGIENLIVKADLLTKSLQEAIDWKRGCCWNQANDVMAQCDVMLELARDIRMSYPVVIDARFPQVRAQIQSAGLAAETARIESDEVGREDGTFAGGVIECNLELARAHLRLAKAQFELVMSRVISEHMRGN